MFYAKIEWPKLYLKNLLVLWAAAYFPITASAISCKEIFLGKTPSGTFEQKEIQNAIGSDFYQIKMSKESRRGRGPSVSVIQRYELSSGLGFSLLKSHRIWNSMYRSTPFTPQGDPRNFRFVFGKEVARAYGFFGFAARNSRSSSRSQIYITVPTAKAFNQVTKSINKRLLQLGMEEINFNFYDCPPISNIELLKEYENGGGETRLFPFSTEEAYEVHDISYHLTAIAIPKAVSQFSALQTKVVTDFVAFAKRKASSEPHLQWILNSDFLDELVFERTLENDGGTGQVGIGLLSEESEILRNSFTWLVGAGLSPLNYLRYKLDEIAGRTQPLHALLASAYKIIRLSDSRYMKLIELFNEFSSSQNSGTLRRSFSIYGATTENSSVAPYSDEAVLNREFKVYEAMLRSKIKSINEAVTSIHRDKKGSRK